MKKSINISFLCLASIVLCGCSRETHPFMAISENMVEYVQSVIDNPDLKNSEDHFKKFFEMQKTLCKDLKGGTIAVKIDDSLGLEVVSEGKIGIGYGESTITIPINIDLKVKDADTAFETIDDLMVLACNDDREVVYVTFLGSEKNLDSNFPDLDVDSIAEVVDTGEIIEKVNPYKVGDVLHKGITIDIEPLIAQQFVNISFLVIRKDDSRLKSAVREKNRTIEEETKAKLRGVISGIADEKTGKEYVLSNGKLGPIEIGKSISDLPMSFEGIYDMIKHETINHESDMEDDWTEDFYQFTKGGKNVLRTDVDGNKITSIVLQEGATFVKTSEGYYVGGSAVELFTKKRMTWETYYEGTAFATNGHYTYHVESDDIIGNDIPEKASDFKPSAKISRIVYN